MKLVLAVVANGAAEGLTDALLAAGFRTTRMASTGGFRREGNTTIMMGLEDEDVDPAIAILRSGAQTMPSRKNTGQLPPDQPAGRGAVFVLHLENQYQL